jgi:type II secretory pathway pseudopilin PulG
MTIDYWSSPSKAGIILYQLRWPDFKAKQKQAEAAQKAAEQAQQQQQQHVPGGCAPVILSMGGGKMPGLAGGYAASATVRRTGGGRCASGYTWVGAGDLGNPGVPG